MAITAVYGLAACSHLMYKLGGATNNKTEQCNVAILRQAAAQCISVALLVVTV